MTLSFYKAQNRSQNNMSHLSTRHTNINNRRNTRIRNNEITFADTLVPDGRWLSAMGCRFRLLEAWHQCISLLSLCECILAVPALVVVLGNCKVMSLLCQLFTTQNPRADPITSFICILGCLLSLWSRGKCPKGDWQPSNRVLWNLKTQQVN